MTLPFSRLGGIPLLTGSPLGSVDEQLYSGHPVIATLLLHIRI